MAEFVTDGYLRFDEVVPKEICDATLKEMQSQQLSHFEKQGQPFSEVWKSEDSAIGKVFRLPKVKGMIESLIGPNPRYDHHFPHLTKAKSKSGENLHQDAEYDIRFESFDIQISFFPADTPAEMGGTLFVPGSQFRRVHESTIKRYQNIEGQIQCVCKAGTIIVWHHNIWHSARSNHTNTDRYMFKLRLNPTVPQQLLWDTKDLHDPQIEKILKKVHPWHGNTNRIESMNRVKLWRSLTKQPEYDLFGFYWSRVLNDPTAQLAKI